MHLPALKAVFAFVILMLYLPLGFAFSLADFTYGRLGLDSSYLPVAVCWAAVFVVGAMLFEWIARVKLLGFLRRRLSGWPAIGVHLVVLNVVLACVVYALSRQAYDFAVVRFLVYENSLQLVWTFVFLATRSVPVTGLVHGMFAVYRFVAINDIVNPIETMFFYTSSHPWFYALKLLLPFVAMALFLPDVVGGKWFAERRTEARARPGGAEANGPGRVRCRWS